MNVHHASLFPDLIGAADYCNIFISESEKETELAAAIQKEEIEPQIVSVVGIPSSEIVTQPVVGAEKKFTSISELLKYPDKSKEVEPARIKLIAKKLLDALTKSLVVDWQERATIRAEMINTTRVLLRKYGYPVKAREYVINNIINVLQSKDES